MAAPTLKVYLAARYSLKEHVRLYRNSLQRQGLEVTSRWLDEPTPADHTMSDISADHQRTSAEIDLADIDAADYMVFFSEDPDKGTPRGGRHVEFGYALAKGKSIIVVGPTENIFHAIPGIKHVSVTWEASDLLREARNRLITPAKKVSRFDDDYMRQRDPKPMPPQWKPAFIVAGPLPIVPAERKMRPMYSGLLAYFPDALADVSHVSYIGNAQHNPGQPLHWAREKSADHRDTAVRHLLESGKRDTDGLRHTAKAAWRVLAELQEEIERDKGADQTSSTKAA